MPTAAPITITVPLTVTKEQIANLLTSALDTPYGFSYYWIDTIEEVEPTSWEYRMDGDKNITYVHDYPLNPGGALRITDDDGETKTLDAAAIERGLVTMATKYPQHFADFLGEEGDAITGDVFLQCCIYDEIIYG